MPDEVFESLVRFLIQLYPNLEIIQRIVYTPDLLRLMKKLEGIVEITPEAPILTSATDLSARNAISIVLLGMYIGSKIGKLHADSLSSSDLSKMTGKARKTISNELPKLATDGIIEKTSEGQYRLTLLGMKKTEDIIDICKSK